MCDLQKDFVTETVVLYNSVAAALGIFVNSLVIMAIKSNKKL